MWRLFENKKEIASSSNLIKKVNEWWISKIKCPCYKSALSYVPVCIYWELWRCKSNYKYVGVKSWSELNIHNVIKVVAIVYSKSVLPIFWVLYKCVYIYTCILEYIHRALIKYKIKGIALAVVSGPCNTNCNVIGLKFDSWD